MAEPERQAPNPDEPLDLRALASNPSAVPETAPLWRQGWYAERWQTLLATFVEVGEAPEYEALDGIIDTFPGPLMVGAWVVQKWSRLEGRAQAKRNRASPQATAETWWNATCARIAEHSRDTLAMRELADAARGARLLFGNKHSARASRIADREWRALKKAKANGSADGQRQRTEAANLQALAFVGSRLEALRSRPEPTSPHPELFDPEPGLQLCVAPKATGKTSLGLHFARSWVCGAAPWDGAPELPGSRALFISREQSATRIDRRARALDACALHLSREVWTRRLAIVARDRDLDPRLRPLLRLDTNGLSLFDTLLGRAADAGDPFGLVVLDSLSRLKPAGTSESDNNDMAEWLDELHGIAELRAVYLLLLHHKGHTPREGDRGAGRGASAIDDVAQVVWDLRRVPGLKAFRELRVYGNAVDDAMFTFRVAPDEDPGKILFWRPERPGVETEDDAEIEDVLRPGEALSTEDLAWRLAGKPRPEPSSDGKRPRPSRKARERAQRVRDQWERAGVAEVVDGPHGAKLIRRVEDAG
jgi:hypothetical protein